MHGAVHAEFTQTSTGLLNYQQAEYFGHILRICIWNQFLLKNYKNGVSSCNKLIAC